MSALVLRLGTRSWRAQRRGVLVAILLAVFALATGFTALCFGSGWTHPGDVLAALLGGGPVEFVITQWRLPRVVAGLVFGGALGLAGAIFQSLTRNPLGSPDVIGLDAGAYTGALLAITLWGGTSAQVAGSSVGFGLLTATVIYLLSLQQGFSGLRLIVIGVACNAVLTAVSSWIILRAELEVAIAATGWSAGTLNGLDWDELRLPFLVLAALCLLVTAASHAMHQTALGDEVAQSTGVSLTGVRVLLVAVGVGLSATVTATAGPIIFIALAAPQIGRRLAGSAGVALLPAALTGAVLLPVADLVAQLLLAPVALPVGVVTAAIGGAYLIWLLVKETAS